MSLCRHGPVRLKSLLAIGLLSFALVGCGGGGDDGKDGTDGQDGATGPAGLSCWDLNENGIKDLPDEDLNGDGVVDVLDCNTSVGQEEFIPIGDGSQLSGEQIAEIGQLVVNIDGVTVSSPPVVDFTVTDSQGNPAVGIAPGTVGLTFAKLLPAGSESNGGLSYWQSYINRVEAADGETPDVLEQAIQATTDSQGTLEELGGGKYRYTFATDVTNVTSPVAVAWEPGLTHRVGLEIRLGGDAEVPLAPNNPVLDFVPDGGAGSGDKNIADTANCTDCHYSFTLHGGPRKTVEYCVTCHNPGTVDQDTGESVDMAYLSHSIHMGNDRTNPYIVYGFGESEHNYGEVTHPQSKTFCETCHRASDSTPQGDAWNQGSTVKACASCHDDGLVAASYDPVTGQAEYVFDHAASDFPDIGRIQDGTCGTCHLGLISRAGPADSIHSRIDGDQRFRYELGKDYVLSIVSASKTLPEETPVINFRVDKQDGTPWNIFSDAAFTDDNASLNLYVAWPTSDIYNGDETGNTRGLRDRNNCAQGEQPPCPEVVEEPGYPYRMYLAALQRDAQQLEDGSYRVTFFAPLPQNITGDPMIGLGGHPAALNVVDADGNVTTQRAAATSTVFYPGAMRDFAVTGEQCNACHKQIQLHGSNRNGNVEVCLLCHNADTAVGGEGWAFGRMIHNIHLASETYAGGGFSEVTYPKSIADCAACHVEGKYSVARAGARAVSDGPNGDDDSWLNDTATTPTSEACGNCHTGSAAAGHFGSQGGQIATRKDRIVGAPPAPNGQEACPLCHGVGAEYDTALFHGRGVAQ